MVGAAARQLTMTVEPGRITASEQRTIRSLLWALKPLANIRPSLPLPGVIALLLVALEQGRGVGANARSAGIDRATMSRNLHVLGDRARNGGPGLGLVSVAPDPSNPGKRQVVLTARGHALVKEVLRGLRRAGHVETPAADA